MTSTLVHLQEQRVDVRMVAIIDNTDGALQILGMLHHFCVKVSYASVKKNKNKNETFCELWEAKSEAKLAN